MVGFSAQITIYFSTSTYNNFALVTPVFNTTFAVPCKIFLFNKYFKLISCKITAFKMVVSLTIVTADGIYIFNFVFTWWAKIRPERKPGGQGRG